MKMSHQRPQSSRVKFRALWFWAAVLLIRQQTANWTILAYLFCVANYKVKISLRKKDRESTSEGKEGGVGREGEEEEVGKREREREGYKGMRCRQDPEKYFTTHIFHSRAEHVFYPHCSVPSVVWAYLRVGSSTFLRNWSISLSLQGPMTDC